MTIALLIELSRRLNFTYDLKLPPDGKWGVVSGNNIWNGLIGQLQRREVDLVAAPLVIDVFRETVADFTQPYFYEQSGIIIKKPVISYSTKLQDPVNPMFNPYYKNVAGRMKIRGLHHFSDSFWYMFGAILCHEFRITRTQKVMEWHNRIQQDDPSVLSSDPAEQIRKVRGGNYAYIGERIYLDMAIGKSCDMSVISSSDFYPMLIAPALPNNSPFLNVFSDEIVTIIETGLIQMWQKKTWPKPENCQEASVTDAKTINVLDFHFAFCLCGIGVILAVLSLIYEHIKRKWILTQRKRQNQQRKTMSIKEISPIDEFYSNINAVNETPLKIAIRCQITDGPRSLEHRLKNYFN
ncbi:unnamed protein product [Mytilus coruscus]|uniref:Uncharacterized protein n=1 Tax=Mytilus coruscus TaxID=42192 RepID=A0A6J8BU83_MYTCO|nr:unnamed protein product [Mytilus coruscus]